MQTNFTLGEFIHYTIDRIVSYPGKLWAEHKRSQELDLFMEENLIDPTLLDRMTFHEGRPIDREPVHIPVRGDQEQERVFVRIINPRSIDGIFAR